MWAKAAASLVLALIVVVLLGLFGSLMARAQGIPGLTPFLANSIPTLVGAFNPSDKSSNISLSNGNLTMSANGSGGSVRSTTSEAAGSFYFEVTSGGSALVIGVANASGPTTDSPGTDSNGVGYDHGGVILAGGSGVHSVATYTTGDVIGVGVSYPDGLVYFYKNGMLQNSASIPSGPLFISVYGVSASATLNLNATYPIPSGYTYWGN